MTGDPAIWEIALGKALGDPGEKPGQNPDVNLQTNHGSAAALFALVELQRAHPHPAYLALARQVAEDIVERQFHNGWFLPGPDHLHTRFDAWEPLALLALEALLRGDPESVPPHLGGRGYIHGNFDGLGRTTDSTSIWIIKR